MGIPLRVLVVEDSEDDADLLLRALRAGGYEPSHRRADTAEALAAALDGQGWDIILGDYTMPRFSGTQALAIVRSRGVDTPFIFVSGTIGEDTAVAAMKAGAQDYVTKGNLKRLIPAIERELREIVVRRERVRAEADRRIAEARFAQILAIAADAVVAVDEDQRIIEFNRGAEATFGYRADEVMGQFVDLLLPSRFAAAHRRHVAEFGRSSVTSRQMNGRREVLGRRKDGSEFPAEATISKLIENSRTTFTAIIRDISERKRAEQKLRQLSEVVEQSSNLVIITDVDGTIEYVNPRVLDVMGFSADEVLGRTPSLWKSGKTSAEDYGELWNTIIAGRDWHGEFENKRKDGGSVLVVATIFPIRDENGRIVHFVSIQQDVTRQKTIEEQLQRAQRLEAIGQLTGGIAHDFNNLLTVVVGNLDLLHEELESRPKAREVAQNALDAALRGAALTQQLLAFARRQSLEPTVVDVNTLVSGTMDLLRRTLGEQIEVETNLADSLWPALADATQVESALANLAINARDAMPNGGRLTIETENKHLDERYAAGNADVNPGNYIMLAVSDTGTGIPAEILDRIFEPFFTTKEQGKGTGLGLSMVYGFAKQSKGHVKIYSEVGHGTTVRLYLPRADIKADSVGPETPVETVEAVRRGATILVVEDNADVRSVAVRQLSDLGYRIIEAENAASALAVLRGEQPVDLLFTDVVMPGGMKGDELAREAQSLRPGLRVLFTSGFAETALRHGDRIRDAGRVLSKPYRRRDLAESIRNCLDAAH